MHVCVEWEVGLVAYEGCVTGTCLGVTVSSGHVVFLVSGVGGVLLYAYTSLIDR